MTVLQRRLPPVGAADGDEAVGSDPGADTARRSTFSVAWPLAILCLGTPLTFVLGVAAFAWSLPGIVFGLSLLVQLDKVRFPRGSGTFALFLMWVSLSVLRLGSATSILLYGYRLSLFLSAFCCFVWLANVSERDVPTETIVRWLGFLFIALIGFGYLALLLGNTRQLSLFQRVLPGGLRNEPFVREITEIRFSELQEFLGYPVSRPSAPFPAANGWGSGVGLLMPFFILSWFVGTSRRRRATGVVLAIVAVIPIVVSLNRTLWLTTIFMLLYVGVRQAVRGRIKLFVLTVVVMVVVVGSVLVSPLGILVSDRFSGSEDSNATRGSVYDEAFSATLDSPLLGYGAPTAQDDGPPVGTHGLLWYTMYSHGFVAVTLLGLWLASMVVRSAPSPDPTSLWLHVVLLLGLMQFPIYGMLPQIVVVGIAAGLAARVRSEVTSA